MVARAAPRPFGAFVYGGPGAIEPIGPEPELKRRFLGFNRLGSFIDEEGIGGAQIFRNRLRLREGPGAIDAEHLAGLSAGIHVTLLASAPAPENPAGDPVLEVLHGWPKDWDVAFTLRARGAFVVTSLQKAGRIPFVEILSEAGSRCTLRNPWPGIAVTLFRDGHQAEDLPGPMLTFSRQRTKRLSWSRPVRLQRKRIFEALRVGSLSEVGPSNPGGARVRKFRIAETSVWLVQTIVPCPDLAGGLKPTTPSTRYLMNLRKTSCALPRISGHTTRIALLTFPLMLSFSPIDSIAADAPANAAPAPNAASTANAPNDEVVMLSPFEVQADSDTSYGALQSNALTAFSVDLQKMPATAQVFTQTFMDDIAATSIEDMLVQYSGTVGYNPNNAGAALDMTGDRNGGQGLGIRGLQASGIKRDGFIGMKNSARTATGNTDNFSVERVELIEGPQSLLYGAVGGGGVINSVSKRARFRSRSGSVRFVLDDNGSKRGTIDYNLGLDKFAVRLATVYGKGETERFNLSNQHDFSGLYASDRLPAHVEDHVPRPRRAQ